MLNRLNRSVQMIVSRQSLVQKIINMLSAVQEGRQDQFQFRVMGTGYGFGSIQCYSYAISTKLHRNCHHTSSNLISFMRILIQAANLSTLIAICGKHGKVTICTPAGTYYVDIDRDRH